jgi:hypothetical protein
VIRPRVLIGCERSGVMRRAFRDLGCYAWSCDLEPADDGSEFHFQCDVFEVIDLDWDLAIFHPECTFLTVAGLFRNKDNPERQRKTNNALEFVRRLLNAPIPRIALENPVSCISSQIRKPDQIIQPYEFGEDASKKTCLWLKGLPKLITNPAHRVRGRIVAGKERWANQTDTGQNRLGPSPDRARKRSVTYPGIAQACATQWTPLLLKAANDNNPALEGSNDNNPASDSPCSALRVA